MRRHGRNHDRYEGQCGFVSYDDVKFRYIMIGNGRVATTYSVLKADVRLHPVCYKIYVDRTIELNSELLQ